MSQQRILKALTSLGLSQIDAEVYLYLASKGPQRTERIAEELNLQNSTLNDILQSLTAKGIVNSIDERVHLFYSLPFHEALELLVVERLEKAKVVEQNRNEILTKWKNLLQNSTDTHA